MNFAIPPNNCSQREAFEKELAVEKQLLGSRIVAFNSPDEVAAWLAEIGFRKHKPVDVKLIKHWMYARDFPYSKPFGSFFTTSAHVFAWLWTLQSKKPAQGKSETVPL